MAPIITGTTASESNASCQRAVNWYSIGGASYGCGARLQVTNPANGKSVVVIVLDNGPSCAVENNAGFYGAQMNAMENATKNAGEMIKKLTLKYNRTRQANITKELIEIISGAEAI